MPAIDLSRIIQKIKHYFPDAHRNPRAQRCLNQLWGYPDVNDCGVFNQIEDALVVRPAGKSRYRASVEIAVAPNGWHAKSTDYEYDIGGGGYTPSVWSRFAYPSREEALDAGIAELIDRFAKLRNGPNAIDAQKSKAEQMVRLLEKHFGLPEQSPARPAVRPVEREQMDLFL